MILKLKISVLFLFICSSVFSQTNFTVVTQVVDSYPVLSPDATTIAFGSNRTGTYQIYTCKPDGSNIVQLTDLNGDTGLPIWSPDGKKILFSSNQKDNSEIYIMNADGTGQKQLTHQLGDDSHAKFSPDGKSIIFNSARTTPDLSIPWSSQFIEIFTMDIDGNNIKQITFNKSVCTYPSFSPDGRKIVFRRIIKSSGLNWSLEPILVNSEIYVVNSDGTMPVNISNSKAYDGWPMWLPNSRTIVFTSNRGGKKNMGQLYKVENDGANLTQITDLNSSFVQSSISKDGKTIFTQRNWETDTYEYGHIVTIKME